jgi:uncharacterized protein with ParB-like and HNH nuclease domain
MRITQIVKTLYRVSDLISWQKTDSLVLSPSFQRRPVWNAGAKSYLIDSIVRGLPIPILFLRDQKTDISTLKAKREVVDGQQRIRTIFSYINKSLLSDYRQERDFFQVKKSHNKELADKNFPELSPDLQQRILDYEFSVHILPANVDDREVLEIFARMNSTGYKLTGQELRNATFYGEFKTSIYELAFEQLSRWRDWKIFTEDNIARMEEVELSSEFAILMLKNKLTGMTQKSIDNVYAQYEEFFKERYEVENRFRIVMDTIDDNLGNQMRFLPYRNKTLFYPLFAFIYDYQYGIGSKLEKSKPKFLSSEIISNVKTAAERIKNKTAPEDVIEAAARRTTHLKYRQVIYEYMKNIK